MRSLGLCWGSDHTPSTPVVLSRDLKWCLLALGIGWQTSRAWNLQFAAHGKNYLVSFYNWIYQSSCSFISQNLEKFWHLASKQKSRAESWGTLLWPQVPNSCYAPVFTADQYHTHTPPPEQSMGLFLSLATERPMQNESFRFVRIWKI